MCREKDRGDEKGDQENMKDQFNDRIARLVKAGGRTGDIESRAKEILDWRDEFRREAWENGLERELLHLKIQATLDRMITRLDKDGRAE